MSNLARKIELGDNHRRAVSVLMRGTERACGDVLEWLTRRSSLLSEVRDDLGETQRKELRELAATVKAEVREFSSKIPLDKKKISRRRSVAAILSTALVDLLEIEDSGLKGYGPLAEDAKDLLREHIRRIATLVERMLHVAEAE